LVAWPWIMVHQKTLKLALILILGIVSSPLFSDADPSSTEIYRKLESVLKNQPSDYFERHVRRMGNNTISLESFVAVEAEWNLLKRIAKQIPDYPTWALPNINDRGGGEKFYIQIASMKANAANPSRLELDVVLSLPALKIPIQRVFQIDFSESKDKNGFILKLSTVQVGDSPVKDMSGFIMFFKSPKNPNLVWAYLDVSVVLTHWIVYESLPVKLLNSETGDRIRILMESYQRFESSQRN